MPVFSYLPEQGRSFGQAAKNTPMARRPKTTLPDRSSTPLTGSIKDFYNLGVEFQDTTGSERSPAGTAEALAGEHQYSQVAIYKARQFAKLYSPEELKELCSLKSPDGKPLGIGHVYELIQVKKRGDRKRLQAAAAKHCWSSRKLKEQRKHKHGYQVATNVGRKPRRAANSDEALLQLAKHADQWTRWANALSSQDDEGTEFTLNELPASVRDKLKVVTEAIKELSETLERLNVRKRNSKEASRKKNR
jgi:hypothetical protein